MEVSGIVSSRRPSFFSSEIGASSSRRTSLHMLKSSSMIVPPSGFSDNGHLQYYSGGLKLKVASSSTRCGGGAVEENDSASKKNMKTLKKRLKLLKGLSKDVTFFSEMEIGLKSNLQQDESAMDHISKGRTITMEIGLNSNLQQDESAMDHISKGRTISEATELLMGQLKQIKEKEKELKMNKKKEKAKMKSARKQKLGCEVSSSSSSSESSDDERGQVMDMSRLKKALAEGNITNELQSPHVAIAVLPENRIKAISPAKIETEANPETKMIEVCMGGKCKKMGSPALMEEFQKTVGVEIAVVGCKCMGKCRTAPNVKVHDVEQRLLVSAAAADQEGGGEEVEKTSSIPLLCTGVGIEDVSMIVSNL